MTSGRSARLLLSFGLLGRAAGLSPAVTRASPNRERSELLRRAAAATYQEVLRPARNLVPGLFSYVDCRPFDDLTVEGRLFLATNLCFALTGGAMAMEGGSPGMGVCFELAGTFSTFYHWAQLRLGGTSAPFVQLALLFDYVFALPTIGGGISYAAAAVSAGAHLPLGAILCGIGATVAFVLACLPVCHEPRRYMLIHGLWHVLGSAAGFILATSAVIAR